ncbi:hypothetical protein PLEOSDRAFT_165245 [Pleurotus ostreatus PC15]|uniref:Uncharacterized protein n=1 Tax=Pleurotus ostreatus (strain PC15) TaxID=1137138 RepID=A0A067P644_PLEO1|nr:hypothetical protein PLEOSDRAFT_165245 [Pleurotus ostreatus PC15]
MKTPSGHSPPCSALVYHSTLVAELGGGSATHENRLVVGGDDCESSVNNVLILAAYVPAARLAAFDNLKSKQGRNKGETRAIYESVDSTTGEYIDKRQEYKFKQEDAARAAASQDP